MLSPIEKLFSYVRGEPDYPQMEKYLRDQSLNLSHIDDKKTLIEAAAVLAREDFSKWKIVKLIAQHHKADPLDRDRYMFALYYALQQRPKYLNDTEKYAELLACIKAILDAEPMINSKWDNKGNSLRLAVQNNDKEAVALLLQYGADPSIKDLKYSVIDLVLVTGQYDYLHMFLMNKPINSEHLLFDVVYKRTSTKHTPENMFLLYDCIVMLLKAGSNSKQSKSSGDTPLHMAIRANDMEVAILLLQYGANPKIENKKKEIPMTLNPVCFSRAMNYVDCTAQFPKLLKLLMLGMEDQGSSFSLFSTDIIKCLINVLTIAMSHNAPNSLEVTFDLTKFDTARVKVKAIREDKVLAAELNRQELVSLTNAKKLVQDRLGFSLENPGFFERGFFSRKPQLTQQLLIEFSKASTKAELDTAVSDFSQRVTAQHADVREGKTIQLLTKYHFMASQTYNHQAITREECGSFDELEGFTNITKGS